MQQEWQRVVEIQNHIVAVEEGLRPGAEVAVGNRGGQAVDKHRRAQHARDVRLGCDAIHVCIEERLHKTRMRRQQMCAARRTRIAFERKQLAFGRLNKIERHLPGHVVTLNERPHPLEDARVLNGMKSDRRALPRCEDRRVDGVRGDPSALADGVTAKLLSADERLRDPRLAPFQRR